MPPASTPLDERYALLAAEGLLGHLEAMRLEIAGVRLSEDPECIHRMRVASRRLRAGLSLFEDALGKPARAWRRASRGITRALGEARDLDVQLERVDERRAAWRGGRERAGLERLGLRLRQARGRVQAGVRAALDELESSRLLGDVAHALQQVRVRAELAGVSAPGPCPAGHRRARAVVGRLTEELLAHEAFVRDPAAVEPLHELRIAAKRLRYTLEAFGPVYAGALDAPVAAAKKIQSLLGDLHDCDVWIAFLPVFREAERQRHLEFHGHARGFAGLLPGLERLLEDRREERSALYRRFLEVWDRQREARIWPDLVAMLAERASAEALS
jgi:CHAD domain-containing protein